MTDKKDPRAQGMTGSAEAHAAPAEKPETLGMSAKLSLYRFKSGLEKDGYDLGPLQNAIMALPEKDPALSNRIVKALNDGDTRAQMLDAMRENIKRNPDILKQVTANPQQLPALLGMEQPGTPMVQASTEAAPAALERAASAGAAVLDALNPFHVGTAEAAGVPAQVVAPQPPPAAPAPPPPPPPKAAPAGDASPEADALRVQIAEKALALQNDPDIKAGLELAKKDNNIATLIKEQYGFDINASEEKTTQELMNANMEQLKAKKEALDALESRKEWIGYIAKKPQMAGGLGEMYAGGQMLASGNFFEGFKMMLKGLGHTLGGAFGGTFGNIFKGLDTIVDKVGNDTKGMANTLLEKSGVDPALVNLALKGTNLAPAPARQPQPGQQQPGGPAPPPN